MTAAAFLVCWCAMLAWYVGAGTPFLWQGGPTIYVAGMFTVLCVASFSAWRHAVRTHETAPLWAAASLVLLSIVGWSFSWNYGPPGAIRAAEHLVLALVFFVHGEKRWQYVIAYILLAGSFLSSLSVLDIFPQRPRVFTGFYYADIVAYLTYAMLITVGYASDDFGPLVRLLLGLRSRLLSRHRYGALSRVEKSCEAEVALGDR